MSLVLRLCTGSASKFLAYELLEIALIQKIKHVNFILDHSTVLFLCCLWGIFPTFNLGDLEKYVFTSMG